MALTIMNEAERCLQCKIPMCQKGCPIRTPISQVIAKFKEGKVMDAGKQLFENNPMSIFCSIVCDHQAQCAAIAYSAAKAVLFISTISKSLCRIPISTESESPNRKRKERKLPFSVPALPV